MDKEGFPFVAPASTLECRQREGTMLLNFSWQGKLGDF
jgi:hypothetical protein